mmetsp:Transcript_52659/g.140401  ORF Transcript_52659/g.140401 Transcript_52659/m.140401 type:complete len:127 (+) Transcript_52659:939-1319(+)
MHRLARRLFLVGMTIWSLSGVAEDLERARRELACRSRQDQLRDVPIERAVAQYCTVAASASPPLGHQLATPLGTPAVPAKGAHQVTDHQQKFLGTKQSSSSAQALARIKTTERRLPSQLILTVCTL